MFGSERVGAERVKAEPDGLRPDENRTSLERPLRDLARTAVGFRRVLWQGVPQHCRGPH